MVNQHIGNHALGILWFKSAYNLLIIGPRGLGW